VGFEVISDDMDEAVKDADVVYAKSWGPLVTDDQTEARRIEKYKHVDHRQAAHESGQGRRGLHALRCRPTATSK
jgi:ornithine carbamoyltransferase